MALVICWVLRTEAIRLRMTLSVAMILTQRAVILSAAKDIVFAATYKDKIPRLRLGMTGEFVPKLRFEDPFEFFQHFVELAAQVAVQLAFLQNVGENIGMARADKREKFLLESLERRDG